MGNFDYYAWKKERDKNSVKYWQYLLSNRKEKDLTIVSFPRRTEKSILKLFDEERINYKMIDESNKKIASYVITMIDKERAERIINEAAKRRKKKIF